MVCWGTFYRQDALLLSKQQRWSLHTAENINQVKISLSFWENGILPPAIKDLCSNLTLEVIRSNFLQHQQHDQSVMFISVNRHILHQYLYRCKAAVDRMIEKRAQYEDWPLHNYAFSPPHNCLPSCRCLWTDTHPIDITSQWQHDWKSASDGACGALQQVTSVGTANVTHCFTWSAAAHRPNWRVASLSWRFHCSVVDDTWLVNVHYNNKNNSQCHERPCVCGQVIMDDMRQVSHGTAGLCLVGDNWYFLSSLLANWLTVTLPLQLRGMAEP